MNSASNSQTTSPFDLQPLSVAENCWMIGFRNPASLLQCNTYLRIFAGPRHGTSVCIDPGSQFDAATIDANLSSLTGEDGWITSRSTTRIPT
jgi:hypothetical protein